MHLFSCLGDARPAALALAVGEVDLIAGIASSYASSSPSILGDWPTIATIVGNET
jgi:hypothetical protein